MKRLAMLMLPILAGCAVVPYEPPYYGAAYTGPVPLYAPAPAYIVPPLSLDLDFGYFRGDGHYGHWRGDGYGRGRGYGHWRGYGHGFRR